MKKSIISAILSVFVFSNQAFAQTTEFWTGKVDYSKLNRDPEVIESEDYNMLLLLASGDEVLRDNLMKMIKKKYRKKSEPVIRGKSAPFLARIQSSYYDEATKKWETVQGLGSFVKVKIDGVIRSAVITVSHLTQGQQLRIYDTKNRLVSIQPGMRLANVDKDVELIILKDDVETPLIEHDKFGLLATEPLKMKPLADDMDIPDYDRIYVSKKQHVPILKSLLPQNSAGHTVYTFSQNREDILRRYINENKTKNALKSVQEAMIMMADIWDRDGVLQEQLVGGGYMAGARMLPGLSGAPVIRDMPLSVFLWQNQYVYFIEGLVQGHHRIENKSYFVGVRSLVKIIKDFKKGLRNYTSNTRWRMKNRMTFRDFGNGILETNMIKTPSGSFYKGDSGNAISVDGDYDPSASGFGIGMQNGLGNNIVGQFVQINGLTLPVLADPQLKTGLPEGVEVTTSFGAKQDLWSLAKMKYQFRDQVTDMISPYECFYQVTDKGIDLQINKFKGDNLLNWHGNRTDLQKGFDQNTMLVRNQKSKSAVEISGLFLTDMTSIGNQGNPRTAGAPTVIILPRDGVEASRVGCFQSAEERKYVFNKYSHDFMKGFEELIGKDMGPVPLPFGR
ncbi:hypothetical protein [Bdellovibrio sp. HCB2-146]|uniref:hypothetical protein n=1 Tax=Bdellovibrio sp. HCB2-146 TaxID=3394362 RepID=UPI0039BD1AC5